MKFPWKKWLVHALVGFLGWLIVFAAFGLYLGNAYP